MMVVYMVYLLAGIAYLAQEKNSTNPCVDACWSFVCVTLITVLFDIFVQFTATPPYRFDIASFQSEYIRRVSMLMYGGGCILHLALTIWGSVVLLSENCGWKNDLVIYSGGALITHFLETCFNGLLFLIYSCSDFEPPWPLLGS